MKLLEKIKQFFFPITTEKVEKPKKTLAELDFIDTVWIKDNDKLYEGWVFDITKKHVIVVVSLSDGDSLEYRFNKTRPLTQVKLVQNDKILFLNKPCAQEI